MSRKNITMKANKVYKNKTVSIKLNDHTFNLLNKMAKMEIRNISNWIESRIIEEAKKKNIYDNTKT